MPNLTVRKRTSLYPTSRNAAEIHANCMLINNLTTPQVETQWPKHNTKQELADSFASFFQEKILQIRKRLHDIPSFTTEPTEVPRLTRFAPMTDCEVSKVISSLKIKSCELDAIPTAIFKTLLLTTIHLITKIVNISLGEGQFIRAWKTAMV